MNRDDFLYSARYCEENVWHLCGDLPDSVLAVIDEAKKYAEGRGVRIEIRTKKDLEIAKELSAVKMAN